MFIYKADSNLFRYLSIFLLYIPHTVYSQLELFMYFSTFLIFLCIHVDVNTCIGVYMNTHLKAVNAEKRLFKKSFFWKNRSKNNFFETFSLLRKKTSLSLYTFASSKQGSMGDGLNQPTANVPDRQLPKVRILQLPHFGSLAQLEQSTTLRTSVSGVRVSHESQYWRFGRVGLLHRS